MTQEEQCCARSGVSCLRLSPALLPADLVVFPRLRWRRASKLECPVPQAMWKVFSFAPSTIGAGKYAPTIDFALCKFFGAGYPSTVWLDELGPSRIKFRVRHLTYPMQCLRMAAYSLGDLCRIHKRAARLNSSPCWASFQMCAHASSSDLNRVLASSFSIVGSPIGEPCTSRRSPLFRIAPPVLWPGHQWCSYQSSSLKLP